MKRIDAALAVAAMAVLAGWALVVPAGAVPPTVTPSPGYDARLQEQRNARAFHQPVAPIARPRHGRRVHGGAH